MAEKLEKQDEVENRPSKEPRVGQVRIGDRLGSTPENQETKLTEEKKEELKEEAKNILSEARDKYGFFPEPEDKEKKNELIKKAAAIYEEAGDFVKVINKMYNFDKTNSDKAVDLARRELSKPEGQVDYLGLLENLRYIENQDGKLGEVIKDIMNHYIENKDRMSGDELAEAIKLLRVYRIEERGVTLAGLLVDNLRSKEEEIESSTEECVDDVLEKYPSVDKRLRPRLIEAYEGILSKTKKVDRYQGLDDYSIQIIAKNIFESELKKNI